MGSEALCLRHATDDSSIRTKMIHTHSAWRYLLRDGRFITASVELTQEHVLSYVSREGVIDLALLSAATEKLLMQLIDLSKATAVSPSVTGQC